MSAAVVLGNVITPYGLGIQACWDGILSGKTTIAGFDRFNTAAFNSHCAALVNGLKYHQGESLMMQMLRILFADSGDAIPRDAGLILATAKGEIDVLEKKLLAGDSGAEECGLDNLLGKVADLTGVCGPGMVISAACVSATAALSRAAAMIQSGECDCVLVAAADGVTEFVYSGFSSLMALDKLPARPFDKHRAGLSIGEAAGFALLMSQDRARRERREILGEIAGFGLSSDANHMTGPSRDGGGQATAIRKALEMAGAGADEVGLISAHGTGTLYNDAMEMKAFCTVFGERKRPVYSIKGAIGHTMGAAGMVEMLMALRGLRESLALPTVNLEQADSEADGWVSNVPRALDGTKTAVVTNSGFGGVNAALLLTAE